MRITIRGQVGYSSFELGRFTKTLRKQLEIEQRNATRAWLREVLMHVPTYTGTARGTYKPLGRMLRVAVPKNNPHLPTGSLANAAKKKYFRYQGQNYPLGFDKGHMYSSYKFSKTVTKHNMVFEFTFTDKLLYYIWNGIQPAPGFLKLVNATPYKELEKAAKAWEHYVSVVMPKKLPKIADYIKVVKNQVR